MMRRSKTAQYDVQFHGPMAKAARTPRHRIRSQSRCEDGTLVPRPLLSKQPTSELSTKNAVHRLNLPSYKMGCHLAGTEIRPSRVIFTYKKSGRTSNCGYYPGPYKHFLNISVFGRGARGSQPICTTSSVEVLLRSYFQINTKRSGVSTTLCTTYYKWDTLVTGTQSQNAYVVEK